MKLFFRLIGIWLLLGCAQIAWSQATGTKIDRVDIKFVGPEAVSQEFIRVNIRVKAGDIYNPSASQDDVHSLYNTGQFYNIRVSADPAADGGVLLTYIVQARPRITEIKLDGNKKLSDSKLKKKITVKVGEPLDEQKLFTDVQEMKKLYEKYGYADTQIKYVLDIDENAGRGTVTFQIVESPKVKITQIQFVGAAAFSEKELRGVIKLKQHWMWSWLTGNGVFKQDDFDDDKDLLTDYYRSHGYLDFRIDDVKMENPTKNTLVIRYYIYEGRQYKVGAITLTGNKIFNNAEIRSGMKANHDYQQLKGNLGPNGFAMDVGDIFTPDGMKKDVTALQDFYGSKGYIDYLDDQKNPPMFRINRIPNVNTGTMDLEFQIEEGQKTYVEKINITGNVKTKDKVIRRELAISPGEVFDMVRVKVSKQRLEGLNYFEKTSADPAPTDPPISGHKNLDVNVEEKNTGNLTFGAGFSSVDSLVGYVEMTQGNFDLFHPPNFTGGGEKLRLKVQLGTERQDYELSFVEPWFMNYKLALGVDLYRHQLNFESPNNVYDESRTGMRLSLTRALWSDFFIGSISYTLEEVGITLNSPYNKQTLLPPPASPGTPDPNSGKARVPQAILEQTGDHLYNRLGTTLAYDTRNSVQLPNHGQRTEIDPEISVGDTDYYKIQLRTAWYFPGFFKGHVIEAVGRTGIAQSFTGGDVPFEDRYYLGGLYSLRGFKYRNISPRENPSATYPDVVNEPIGGDSFWFSSVEYSIPLMEKDNGLGIRVAGFFDIGSVGAGPTTFSGNFDDDWGLGFRLNIPHLGPLRLDYGIPITHDRYNGAGGQFNFGAGYTREF
jgi:outer membrane protein insertion porin family